MLRGLCDDETPRRFFIGEHEVVVKEVLDRWLAPDQRYFKVRADDESTYNLRHDVEHDRWQMTLFEAGKRQA